MTLASAAATGMLSAVHAAHKPHAPALLGASGTRSFSGLHTDANRLARLMRRAGLRAGEGVAPMCSNRPEFIATFLAALRGDIRKPFWAGKDKAI